MGLPAQLGRQVRDHVRVPDHHHLVHEVAVLARPVQPLA